MVAFNLAARVSEVLHLTTEESGASVEYAKGALVGLMAGLLAGSEMGGREILEFIAKLIPANFRKAAVPDSWLSDLLEFRGRV